MNIIKNKWTILSFSILLLSGCADKKIVYSSFTMPPKQITDIKDLMLINIKTPSIQISGNYLDETDNVLISNFIKERVSADIIAQGYYKVTDNIYISSNKLGEQKLNEFIKNSHGYDNLNSPLLTDVKASNISISLNIILNNSKSIDVVKHTLIKTPYNRTDKNGIPSSTANYKGIVANEVKTSLRADNFISKAILGIKITNYSNKIIYNKTFTIHNSLKIGGNEGLQSMPTKMELLSLLLNKDIQNFVKDISPYKETRELEINEDGFQKAVLLLNAQAYTEAINALEVFIKETKKNKKNVTSADLGNLALAYEIIGEMFTAKEYYEDSVKIDSGNILAIKGLGRIEKLLAQKKKMKKIREISKKESYKTKENKGRN